MKLLTGYVLLLGGLEGGSRGKFGMIPQHLMGFVVR